MKTTKLFLLAMVSVLFMNCEKEADMAEALPEGFDNKMVLTKAVDPKVYKGVVYIEFDITKCEIKSENGTHEITMSGPKCEIYVKLYSGKDIDAESYSTRETSIDHKILEYSIKHDMDGIEYPERYHYNSLGLASLSLYKSRYYINFAFDGHGHVEINYVK